jgi:hypothetical protein
VASELPARPKPAAPADGASLALDDNDYASIYYLQGMIKWIDAAVSEGEGILQGEPMYRDMDEAISFIMGDQVDTDRPAGLSSLVDNRTKKCVLETVSALTDIHPLFGFKTFNSQFQSQSDVLGKLARAWWVNNFCDLSLSNVIRFAAGLGTGYAKIDWDASAANGDGDIVIRALDPRDVLPIRPTYDRSIQSWEGVITRRAATLNELRARYPDKLGSLTEDSTPSLASRAWTRARQLMSRVIGPSTVDVLNGVDPKNKVTKVPTATVHEIYVKDRTVWTGDYPVIMGDPEAQWSYTVYPIGSTKPDGQKATRLDALLYPRGRCIIATKRCVLYDGPNPYWHGMFPIVRLQLDPWPWTLLPPGLAQDLIPLQKMINEIINGVIDHTRKVLRPAIKANKKSIPDSMWARVDTRLAGLKMRTNPAAGAELEFVSPDALDQSVMEVLKMAIAEIDNLAGTANLIAMTQLQQAPGADSIERLMEALTPILRMKGRLLEACLREMGEMVKSNFFQFYNQARRVSMLGEQGIDFSDFDFDPGSLVPGMSPNDEGYDPHLDKKLDRGTRAGWHAKNFTFQITPNSLLAISQISRKLLYLQLRAKDPTLIDRWTLYEVLEIPNGGSPPDDASTITDRAKAEMTMFPPPSPPEGRPPTNQQPPQILNKVGPDGEQRQTLSSSGSGGHSVPGH